MPDFELELSEHIDMLKLARSGRGISRVTLHYRQFDIRRRSSSAPPECLRRCKAIRLRRLGLRHTEAPSLLSMVIIVFCILLQPKAKRRWSELKKVLKDADHIQILQQLFDSNGNPSLILVYFTWLEKDYGVSHSLGQYCRLLNLLANAKLYPKIKRLLNDFVAKKEGHSNSSIFHALSMVDDWFCGNSVLVDMLILAYVKNLKIDLAVKAFKLAGHYGVELSVNSCNPMLAALVDQGTIQVMENVHKVMIRRKVQPDVITFNIVISGLCKAGKLQKARDLMGDMKVWGISPTVVTYNTLINGYWKKGSVGRMYKADALLKEMLSKKICPNEITYNTLIDGFCKDENLPAAKKVFKDMEMQDLKADVVTYSSLISGLWNDQKIHEALDLRDEMLGCGLQPNFVTYSALINSYSKKGMLKEARELSDDAARQGLAPTAVTFGG
ncbi:hypothetical protein Ancab_000599 [Ancistrocladus abbreviatus]